MRELLEAGVHFGHQTRRWNPKMRRFIFGERGGIYIIDLQQTITMLQDAHDYVRNIAERNGTVLFVGTKKQSQDAVEEHARRVGMPYVNHRWLGGLLTNYKTIQERIGALHELRRQKVEGQLDLLPTKERQSTMAELEKLETNLGGLADTRRLPDAMVVIDLKKEALAVREARRLGITVIGLVDTNCDPDDADFIIPGNDDAIRSTGLIVRVLANAIAEGQAKVRPAEFEATENGEPGEPGDETQGAPDAQVEANGAAEQAATAAIAADAPPAEAAAAADEPATATAPAQDEPATATAPAEEPVPVPEAVPEPPVQDASAEEPQPVAEAATTEEAPASKDEKSG
jgi:small subunit ribosomal protein S2